MEAAVRWSPHSTAEKPEFLVVDVQANRLELRRSIGSGARFQDLTASQSVYTREKVPNYTAFDWSKTSPYLVAVGSQSGEANLVPIDPNRKDDTIVSFPIRHQRKCNSIAFSNKDFLATGLDRVRNDYCMNLYDIKSLTSSGVRPNEPFRKLASSEPISSIKFFSSQPDLLACGVTRQCIRLFDIRDPNTTGVHYFNTRQVHNLAIDPLDENYFVSAGPAGEPTVSVWDKRMASKSTPSTPSSENGPLGPVLELKPAVDNTNNANIWALRFSGTKRACFGILSSTGEIKVVETSQHHARVTLDMMPTNHYGGNTWGSSRTYVKRTHHLTYPWYDPENGRHEKSRVIGYDFVTPGILQNEIGIVALHPDRTVELMKVPHAPRQLNFTAMNELCSDSYHIRPASSRADRPAIAVELTGLQDSARNSEDVKRMAEQSLAQTVAQLHKYSMEGHKAPPSYESPLLPSSGNLHEQLITLWFPDYIPGIGDALNIMRTQQRRCREGYMLNSQKNKDIVSNDPWLVDMWETVKRYSDMAKDNGMVASHLDLSYLGVYAIWNGRFGSHRNRNLGGEGPIIESRLIDAVTTITSNKGYPGFMGHKTRFPAHRQLCLALCGWTFSKERLRTFCRRLIDNGDYYKAVVIAVLRGFKDLAQELLRFAIQQKYISNIGLGAVIACETVTAEQRELCQWMAEETEDPYLKALLNYFIKGDWKIVADMTQLALSDRVGVALKYLDDNRLGDFIKLQTQEAMLIGNVEGLVLTGLTDQAMTLFSNYIKKVNDLQTAVLAMSFTCPLYIDDARFEMWKEMYEMQLQSWRAFSERTKYLDAHAQLSKSKNGRLFGKVNDRPATMRCPHCLSHLAQRVMKNTPDGPIATIAAPKRPELNNLAINVSNKDGLLCLHCGRRTPSCGICGLQLANPDPRRLNGATAKKLAEEDAIARQPVRCMTCDHTFHGHHARDWFARNPSCPVPSCKCTCAFLL